MANISVDGRVGYIFSEDDNTWYPLSGVTNTAADFSWSGTHNFDSTVDFSSAVVSKDGFNNFQNPASRDAAIPSPSNGATAFVRQTDTGDQINELQYYYNGSWRYINDGTSFKQELSTSYTLSTSDVAKTILMDSLSDQTVVVPPNSSEPFLVGQKIEFIRLGAGNVTFSEGSGVNILSKYDDLSIAAQYSAAALVKTDTNTWLLVGDLTTI